MEATGAVLLLVSCCLSLSPLTNRTLVSSLGDARGVQTDRANLEAVQRCFSHLLPVSQPPSWLRPARLWLFNRHIFFASLDLKKTTKTQKCNLPNQFGSLRSGGCVRRPSNDRTAARLSVSISDSWRAPVTSMAEMLKKQII